MSEPEIFHPGPYLGHAAFPAGTLTQIRPSGKAVLGAALPSTHELGAAVPCWKFDPRNHFRSDRVLLRPAPSTRPSEGSSELQGDSGSHSSDLMSARAACTRARPLEGRAHPCASFLSFHAAGRRAPLQGPRLLPALPPDGCPRRHPAPRATQQLQAPARGRDRVRHPPRRITTRWT